MENENNSEYPFINRPGVDPQTPPPERKVIPVNSFARAAMVLGIVSLALAFTFTVYPTLILGALSIILALLSRGSEKKMVKSAKTGVIIGTIALCANLVLVSSSLYMVFSNDTYRQQFNEIYESMYGKSFEDTLKEIQNGSFDESDLY